MTTEPVRHNRRPGTTTAAAAVAGWRKSSFSTTNGSCVEVNHLGAAVALRNSVHPDRGTLRFDPTAVTALVAACAAGELDDTAHT
jgi:hypothetical protein